MKMFKILGVAGIIFMFFLSLTGCSNEFPFQSEMDSPDFKRPESKNKKQLKSIYPQYASLQFNYVPVLRGYEGGKLKVANGSAFMIQTGSLIPPLNIDFGSPVLITMLVEKPETENYMIFTFEPSGTQFDGGAFAWLDFRDLYGKGKPEVYYIHPNGDLEFVKPEQIDKNKKKILVKIYHFSRYKLALSKK